MITLQCHHYFHQSCLQQWFRYKPVCPICRYDIRTYTSNSDNHYALVDNSNVILNSNSSRLRVNTNITEDQEEEQDQDQDQEQEQDQDQDQEQEQEQFTQQLDSLLTQLFTNLASTGRQNTNVNSNNNYLDPSGNIIITYTLT